MDQRAPQEYVLEIFADQTFVKDIVKGWLKTPLNYIQIYKMEVDPFIPQPYSTPFSSTDISPRSALPYAISRT